MTGAEVLLELPAGTTIHPAECGFALPDGRYLRIYEDGVRTELPNGRAASGEPHMARPQLFAHRLRVGGNPHGYGPHRAASYRMATDVTVRLPDRLASMDDEALIDLCHGLLEAVVHLEMRIDLDDGDVVAEFADGKPYSHVLDLSGA